MIFVAIGFAWLIDLWNSKVIEKLSQNETFNRLNGDIGQTGPGLPGQVLLYGPDWTTKIHDIPDQGGLSSLGSSEQDSTFCTMYIASSVLYLTCMHLIDLVTGWDKMREP